MVKGHRADMILHYAQENLLNERIRQVHFTTDALQHKIVHLHQNLPNSVSDRITLIVLTAELTQHHKEKERQTKQMDLILSIKQNTAKLSWRKKDDSTTTEDMKVKLVKNLSDREHMQPEREVLDKGLNNIIMLWSSLQQPSETAIFQLRKLNKVHAALANAQPSNITSQKRLALEASAAMKVSPSYEQINKDAMLY